MGGPAGPLSVASNLPPAVSVVGPRRRVADRPRNPRAGPPRRRVSESAGSVHRWQASHPPSREARAWARRNAARGRRSWQSPIGRGARSPSTSRVPRRMKSPWCTPHSRSDLSASSQRLIGDNAYESDRLDANSRACGVELIAPHRRTRTQRTQDGRPLRRYRRRWKVERLFAWLQNFRRIVVRYERFSENFLGMLHLACCLILLRCL